jgi:flagellar biosynthesis regulator FlbT
MAEALDSAAEGNFYKALQNIRKLLPYEEILFQQRTAAAAPPA